MNAGMPGPNWQYNEMRHVGTNYASQAEVQAYDERMRKLRDIDGEIRHALDLLNLQPHQTLLEIGTGTGSLAIAAAKCCRRVVAVDISAVMLEYAAGKAMACGASNVEFVHAGFLTFAAGEQFDAAASQIALHHLPDFWKMVAMHRLAGMLRPGARFFLQDVVYSFDVADHAQAVEGWLADYASKAGPHRAEDAARHVRDEHSTMAWMMEGILQRAGFRIEKAAFSGKLFAEYLCVKQ